MLFSIHVIDFNRWQIGGLVGDNVQKPTLQKGKDCFHQHEIYQTNEMWLENFGLPPLNLINQLIYVICVIDARLYLGGALDGDNCHQPTRQPDKVLNRIDAVEIDMIG